MAPEITNCVRCNKVFRKTVSDKCPACAAREQEQFSQLYQLLQDSRLTGGIHATELAMKVGMSEDVLEEIFLEGRLGTSSHFVNFTCRSCNTEFPGKEGHSRICIRCRSQVSAEAGVSIHSLQDVEKRAEENKRRQQSQLRAQGISAESARGPVQGANRPSPGSHDHPSDASKAKLTLKKVDSATTAAPPTQRSAGLKRLE